MSDYDALLKRLDLPQRSGKDYRELHDTAAAAIRDLQRQLHFEQTGDCPACNGTGVVDSAEHKCGACGGRGYVEPSRIVDLRNQRDEARTRAAEAEAVIEKFGEIWDREINQGFPLFANPRVVPEFRALLDSTPSTALAGVKAQAWDEGWVKRSDQIMHPQIDLSPGEKLTPREALNPYRQETGDE